jgi:hypothetical protein
MLEQAIEKLPELPEREQDLGAAELLGHLADFPAPRERTAVSNGRSACEPDETASGLNHQSQGANFPLDRATAPMRADLTPVLLCLAAQSRLPSVAVVPISSRDPSGTGQRPMRLAATPRSPNGPRAANAIFPVSSVCK